MNDQAAQIADINRQTMVANQLCHEKTTDLVGDENTIADTMSKKIHIEKKQRQQSVSKEYSKRAILEKQVREFTKFTDELADEVRVEKLQAKATIRKALKGKDNRMLHQKAG